MKLLLSRPCRRRSAIHSASRVSVLRPGTDPAPSNPSAISRMSGGVEHPVLLRGAPPQTRDQQTGTHGLFVNAKPIPALVWCWTSTEDTSSEEPAWRPGLGQSLPRVLSPCHGRQALVPQARTDTRTHRGVASHEGGGAESRSFRLNRLVCPDAHSSQRALSKQWTRSCPRIVSLTSTLERETLAPDEEGSGRNDRG